MEETIRGFDTVRVSKDFLLERIIRNRGEHDKLFLKALDGWHKKTLEALERELERVRADKYYCPEYYLPMPVSHLREYNRILEMLEASLDDVFELTAKDFKRYVMDDWEWKQEFISNARSYTVSE